MQVFYNFETPRANECYSQCDDYVYTFIGIISPIFSGITLAGNCINVAVFKSGLTPKSSINVLLLGLAVTEGIEGAAFLVDKILVAHCLHCSNNTIFVITKVGDMSFYSANWIVVFVSLFRCIAITIPLHLKHLCTIRRARIVICACVICNIVREIPYFIRYFVIYFDEDEIILETINQVVGRIIPCFIVLVLIVISVLSVKTPDSHLIGHTIGTRCDDKKVTRMLLVLTAIFFATNLYCVIVILLPIYGNKVTPQVELSTSIVFGFNSSVNIFLYLIMAPMFRAVLFSMVKSKWKAPKNCIKCCHESVIAGPVLTTTGNQSSNRQLRESKDDGSVESVTLSLTIKLSKSEN